MASNLPRVFVREEQLWRQLKTRLLTAATSIAQTMLPNLVLSLLLGLHLLLIKEDVYSIQDNAHSRQTCTMTPTLPQQRFIRQKFQRLVLTTNIGVQRRINVTCVSISGRTNRHARHQQATMNHVRLMRYVEKKQPTK